MMGLYEDNFDEFVRQSRRLWCEQCPAQTVMASVWVVADVDGRKRIVSAMCYRHATVPAVPGENGEKHA